MTRPSVKRLTAALLLFLLILLSGYVLTRIAVFSRIFREHAGVALTQDEVAIAHNSTDPDPRSQVVPKIIHQIFHNWNDPNNETLPSDWEKVRHTCISLNPDWEYKLWTEKSSRDFIETEYRWFLSTYDNFKFPVQKIDSLRYFFMRHYGGIYLDLDNGCLKNLEPLLYYPAWVTDGGHGALSNNILGAQPNHAFWILLTDSLISYAWNYPFPYITISYATGQWFETVVWEKYHAQLPKDAPPLTRVMMDMRPGAASWVFFTQERGGTWDNWDNHVFGYIGNNTGEAVGYLVGFLGAMAVGFFVTRTVLRCVFYRYRGYRRLGRGNKSGRGDEEIELSA